jgi:hypothetical protein
VSKQVKVPDYTASERQTVFHKAVADEKLYGGAAGGGKTAAIVAEAVTLALQYPGIRINMFRRTRPELMGTIHPEIMKQTAAYINAGHMTWKGQENRFVLTNGSTIILNYLDNANDVYRYQGAEMPIIAVDELTQFPQAWIEYLITRNRTDNPNWPVMFFAGTNPGGVGHGWVKSRFIDPVPPETINTVELEDGHTVTRVFIPAKVDDHPSEKFREDYSRKLAAISDPQLRKALRDGDWNVFAGQVFTEWRTNLHTIEPFQIPAHWVKWFSYDHGYNTQAAGSWFTKDPQTGRTFKYRELYVSQVGVKDIAQQIKMYEGGENITFRLADPAIWKGAGNQNTGDTVAQMFQKEGISFQPANNDRLAGLAQFHSMLALAPDGLPWLQYFTSCVESIRTIPALPYDKNRVEDVDTNAEDHLYDSDRYGLIGQRPAVRPTPHKPQNMVKQKYRR